MKKIIVILMLFLTISFYSQTNRIIKVIAYLERISGEPIENPIGKAFYVFKDTNVFYDRTAIIAKYDKYNKYLYWNIYDKTYVKITIPNINLEGVFYINDEDNDGIFIINETISINTLPPQIPNWAKYFSKISLSNGTKIEATTFLDEFKLIEGEGIILTGNNDNKEIEIKTVKQDLNSILANGNTTDKDIITSGTIFTKEFKLDKSFQENDILRVNNNGYLFYDKEFVHYLIDLSKATSLLKKQIAISKPNDYICELKLGLEYPKENNIAGYRFILGAEDNGIYGYSGAIVFENALENEVEMFLMGDTFKLGLNINNNSTNYFFSGDNFYMETNNNTYEFYHTGNDANLAKKDSVNEFEANQFATKFIETTKYKADNPRPYGYPQTAPNPLDNEFEDEDLSNYHWYSSSKNPSNGQEENPPSIVSQNLYNGYLYISNNTAYNNKYFVKEIVETQDIILIAKISYPSYGNMLGINIIDSNGNGYGLGIYHTGSDLFYYRYSFTQWGTPTLTSTNIRAMGNYIMIRKRGNNISLGFSQDCITWITLLNEGTWTMNNNVKYIGFLPNINTYLTYPKISSLAIDLLRVE